MQTKKMSEDRRTFLKNSTSCLAGAAIIPPMILKEQEPEPKEEKKKRKIITRKLGKTDLDVPIVSMGVMNADNPNLVRAALDAGITHLDTAHVYQRGRNEEMVGEVIKDYPRDSFVLATKVVGEPMDRKTGMFTKDAKAGPFLEKFETSLKRLGVDHVDILYLHSVVNKEGALFEPFLTAMENLKKEGKIRFIGVSTHSNEPEVIRAAVESKIYDVVLTAYNFRQPHVAEVEKAMGEASKKGLGIIGMKTQAGVYWDDERQKKINMKAALKWVLQNGDVHTSIPGFTTFDQLEEDLAAMEELTLTPEERKELQLGEKTGMRRMMCSQCSTCLDQCPHDIDIPAMMRSYMYAYGYRNLAAAKETFEAAHDTRIVCGDCMSCAVSCPVSIDVQSRILDVARVKNIPDEFII